MSTGSNGAGPYEARPDSGAERGATAGVWAKHHSVGEGVARLDVTGLWAGSLPGFVEGCSDGGDAYVERRGDRTFVVTGSSRVE